MPDAAVKPRAYSAEEAAALCALDTKEVFGDAMAYLAERDQSLVVTVSDYGRRLSLERMLEARPDALVQCGIAEQSQVEMACALANEGLHVFAPAYTPFITARVLDQVRVLMGMMVSPVCLVGLSAGYGAGILGASHMGLEDIACMRSIPNIRVVCPADKVELHASLLEFAAAPQPTYIRITDVPGGFCVHPEGGVVELSRAELLAGEPGTARVGIVCCGAVSGRALEAAQILQEQGVSCAVLKMSCVKPLDEDALRRLLGCELVVSVEEHSIVGGMGGALAEFLSGVSGSPALLRLGAPDAYFEADRPAELLARAGLTGTAIADAVSFRLSEGLGS